MIKICKDEDGLYANVSGWIARPNGKTQFTEGEETQGKRFEGGPFVGMGQRPDGRGNTEYWLAVEFQGDGK